MTKYKGKNLGYSTVNPDDIEVLGLSAPEMSTHFIMRLGPFGKQIIVDDERTPTEQFYEMGCKARKMPSLDERLTA